MAIQILIDEEQIANVCRRHHIRKLALFGSVLRDDFQTHSDVDLLVEFERGHVPGLLTLAGMEIELSDILGWPADLRTAEDLSRYFRDQIVASAQSLYESR